MKKPSFKFLNKFLIPKKSVIKIDEHTICLPSGDTLTICTFQSNKPILPTKNGQ